jgi:hypothetical protein
VRRLLAVVTLLGAILSVKAEAQTDTLLDHPVNSWFYLGGQINVITQHHGDFPSPYEGVNSLKADSETATSRLLTLYVGARRASWEVVVNVESAGGGGLSDALGLAGFTNLDVVRNPTLGSSPYLARLIVRKTFALSTESIDSDPTPFSLAPHVPAKRIDVRAGKFGLADFFDANGVLSDSHRQFTNWTVDNNGGFDYAADTRGYTYAVLAEFDAPGWSLRGAEALMPTVANGITLDTNLTRARGENLELELRPAPRSAIRLLGYANHANMGSYAEAIDAFLDGADPRPDIEAHRAQGRVKYGAGLNVERSFSSGVRVAARIGWNEGANESFAYTEANTSIAGGVDGAGTRWRRPADRVGLAIVSNGLSDPHREYLRLGGTGFLLGDGTLRYGRESIVEGYYTGSLWRGISVAGGLQYVARPGYNRDRGPVLVQMFRLHVDL